MSFSVEVKEELSKLNNLANKEIVKYELLGYFATNHVTIQKNKIKFSTENEYNINRFGKLISNLQYINYDINLNGKSFYITLKKPELPEIIYSKAGIMFDAKEVSTKLKQNENLAKAFVRGCFLGGGSINNPKNMYHLEIILANKENAQIIFEILKQYQVLVKILEKKKSYSLYTKDGDEISKFLALIQANKSVLKFEEIRVLRDIRNNVNRKVNCETANLNKTVNAAFKQIEDIHYLQELGEFKKLSKVLQEIANLRLENPEASLVELGKLLPVPIGKSGVNHRFQAISKIVEERRKN
ncbi:MAG: DNA-binding protein WhiA [Clostridia bacterium]|nr:DNA-binding protein WhiA [Clostridia bacterium]